MTKDYQPHHQEEASQKTGGTLKSTDVFEHETSTENTEAILSEKGDQISELVQNDESCLGEDLKKTTPKKKSNSKELGKKGEDAAAQFLMRKYYDILDRNWVCSAGEVDIVAEDEEALVFVEVKTRSSCAKGLPEEAVTLAKRRRYEKIAALYLRDHSVESKAVRFDVISILVVAPDRAFLRHHRDAFALGE